MRTFTDCPLVDHRGERFQQVWYFCGPLLFLFAIAVGGSIIGFSYLKTDTVFQAEPSRGYHAESGEILIEAFLRTYERSRGYAQYMEEPKPLYIMGSFASKDSMVTLSGELDLFGSGSVRLSFGMEDVELVFQEGKLTNKSASVLPDEVQVVCALVHAWLDPLIVLLKDQKYEHLHVREASVYGRDMCIIDLSAVGFAQIDTMHLDKSTLLPSELRNAPPDRGVGQDGSVEHFHLSEYEFVNGLRVPTRIVWFQSGGEAVPIYISKVSLKG